MIQSQPPDLVLLDLMLPDMDGLSICRRLRADPRTAGVVIAILSAGERIRHRRRIECRSQRLYHQTVQSCGAGGPRQGGTEELGAGGGNRRRAFRRRGRDQDPQSGHPSRATHGPSRWRIGGTQRDRVSRLAVLGPETRLGFHQRTDSRCGSRRQLRDHRAGRGRADRGPAEETESAGKYIETLRGVGYRFKE